ncbi:NADPH-dependent FMN reductase [Acidisphaera sp. S103]|uniref:NADPH-dependent FMN reductase n=1 Tax=Acidisphaera sp. S103 TaxID=1747223 RepID=UPI0020B121E0|nr:NAD(P)H-dependent oxidoreductase [Acidisphaera sp. S103]
MGSTRANRLCPTLATWIAEIARVSTGLRCELVDLANWRLPTDDEPDIPALGRYVHEHTRAWSAKIAGADAFVFVTPQYNWGYPAPLKNAIDHLYNEWRGKPLVIISYGGHGGGKCAAQLAQVAQGVGMRVIPTMPGITLSNEVIQGAPVTPDKDLKDQIGPIQQAFVALTTALAEDRS